MSEAQPPAQYTTAAQPAAQREQLVPTVYIVIGVIVAIAVSVGFILLLVWLANNYPDTIEALRDIFIIALGLTSCLSGITLILLLIAVTRLVNMLEYELKPILLKTNETLGTIRGTTTFVSENVVRPVTTVSSYAAGFRRGVQTLFGDPRRNLGK